MGGLCSLVFFIVVDVEVCDHGQRPGGESAKDETSIVPIFWGALSGSPPLFYIVQFVELPCPASALPEKSLQGAMLGFGLLKAARRHGTRKLACTVRPR